MKEQILHTNNDLLFLVKRTNKQYIFQQIQREKRYINAKKSQSIIKAPEKKSSLEDKNLWRTRKLKSL